LKRNPIFCAIDTNDIHKATSLLSDIAPHIGGIKVGLEFFTSLGVRGIEEVSKFNKPLFIDLKLYDIPNTVTAALRNILALKPEYTTLHISGGRRMLENCVEEKIKANSSTKLIGVTMLTSFDDKEINEIGVYRNVKENVKLLSGLAENCKLDGIVCSPQEISFIKSKFKLEVIAPGIRLNDTQTDDQKRTLTAKEALKAGADILVIGRPITQADSPSDAARSIYESIQ
tara:strand:- start:578 stop:1264 length:687 start_codon:yes stop_codon:yes gene_type:complete